MIIGAIAAVNKIYTGVDKSAWRVNTPCVSAINQRSHSWQTTSWRSTPMSAPLMAFHTARTASASPCKTLSRSSGPLRSAATAAPIALPPLSPARMPGCHSTRRVTSVPSGQAAETDASCWPRRWSTSKYV